MPNTTKTVRKLKSMRHDLTQRMQAIETDIHHKKEPVEKDFAEQVTQRENDDVLLALDGEIQQTVRLINSALKRIEDGNYGYCTLCGEKIPEKRLEALPFATTCISCAEK